MNEYEKMTCMTPKCDSKSFVAVKALQWREGGGMTERPVGYQCAKWGADVNAADNIREMRKRHNQEKIKELEADV